ncbi:MAG: hypothetical protein HFH53_08830 [Hespellia sp.]|jgi:hypothetical protein|nr:hypothetical protein [Hespellia sp.]
MNIIQNILKNNECYKTGVSLKPSKLMVHSTACPGVPACSFAKSWNTARPNGRQVCVHGFVDVSSIYQTLPWNMQAWHCGGKGNQMAVGIELCEPANYSDKSTSMKIIKNAIELYAYLCSTLKISPDNIISHKEGNAMGIASNHGDPDHWWRHIGYSMNQFRKDVKSAMGNQNNSVQVPGDPVNDNHIHYRAHCQTYGWLNSVRDGQTSGTVGKAKRLEAMKIDLRSCVFPGLKFLLRLHIQGYGWKEYKVTADTHDTVLGTTGKSKRIEAMAIEVLEGLPKGYKIQYCVHEEKHGWTQWIDAPNATGTVGIGLRVEAFRLRIVKCV